MDRGHAALQRFRKGIRMVVCIGARNLIPPADEDRECPIDDSWVGLGLFHKAWESQSVLRSQNKLLTAPSFTRAADRRRNQLDTIQWTCANKAFAKASLGMG